MAKVGSASLQEQLNKYKVVKRETRLAFVRKVIAQRATPRLVNARQFRSRIQTIVRYVGGEHGGFHLDNASDVEDDGTRHNGRIRLHAFSVDATSMNTDPAGLLTLCEEMLEAGEDAEQFLIDLFSKAR